MAGIWEKVAGLGGQGEGVDHTRQCCVPLMALCVYVRLCLLYHMQELDPYRAYHLEVHWLVCSAKNVREFVQVRCHVWVAMSSVSTVIVRRKDEHRSHAGARGLALHGL